MKKLYILATIIGLCILLCVYSLLQTTKEANHFSESVKVALRDSGNQLLLFDNDSTSLISPIIELEKNKYQLSFETHLAIQPTELVESISNSFIAANLPNKYIVEVIDCSNKEVHYSFQIAAWEEHTIIPCAGRKLPTNCYTITVFFRETDNLFTIINNYTFFIVLLLIFISIIGYIFNRKKNTPQSPDTNTATNYISIGHYKFYEQQHELIRQEEIIKLTTKECELIKIFSQYQNQVVQREYLIKEIWEDKGVFVGRSLDAFISRIRKKLKNDPSIKIVNVHGVGYRLEVLA